MNAKVAKIMEPKKILSSNVGSGGNVKEPLVGCLFVTFCFDCYICLFLL